MLNNLTFAYPNLLYLLLLIPLILFWYWRQNKKRSAAITYSNLEIFRGLDKTLKERLRHLPMLLRLLGISLLIVALARPQSFSSGENVYTEGIDVAMLLPAYACGLFAS